ncbi:hypothetical protein ACGFWF_40840 [Streptomyces sp. NPDC048581]|uniref:hypothetical protein n=1 Tax=Streptomyces sp. NPDC048581 TaxID=3365572 RepID=UPI00371B98CB
MTTWGWRAAIVSATRVRAAIAGGSFWVAQVGGDLAEEEGDEPLGGVPGGYAGGHADLGRQLLEELAFEAVEVSLSLAAGALQLNSSSSGIPISIRRLATFRLCVATWSSGNMTAPTATSSPRLPLPAVVHEDQPHIATSAPGSVAPVAREWAR